MVVTNSITTKAVDAGVTTPQTRGSSTGAIVDAVKQKFDGEYYNKNEVYNNDDFRDAVRSVDNPRVDAIRIGSRPEHDEQLPPGYVYMWIEEN